NKRVRLQRSSSSVQLPAYPASLFKSRTSSTLLLNRCLSNGTTGCRSSSLTEESSFEGAADWKNEDRCMDYGTPPPIEEPQCYSMCLTESSTSDENNCPVQVSRELLGSLLVEHARTLGCRLHVLEDLEHGKLDAGPSSARDYLAGCKKPHELNALLLYASYLGKAEVLPVLVAQGADPLYVEPELGVTALHLCAFANCLAGVRYLLEAVGGVAALSKKAHTAYHYAAFGDAVDVAGHFARLGWSQESPLGEETVLHAAARNGSGRVLGLLAPSSPHLNALDGTGFAAIHYAAERDDVEGLRALLKAGCLVDMFTRRGETALQLTAEAGYPESLKVLLESGANPGLRNRRGQTALHLAARTHSVECVVSLLNHGGSDPNSQDNDGRTPLHVALGRSMLSYDVAEELVGRKADVNRADKYGYTPLHVAALNEMSSCVDLLIQQGADLSARTKGGTSALSIILRKTPSSLDCFERRLDASLGLHHHGSATGEVELRLDFHPLLQHQQQGEIGYLGTFVKEGYKEILEHPLCQSFLHLKWQKIRKYYVGRLLFYLLYVLVLTGWVITALAHNCYNESHGQLDNLSRPLCANSSGLNGFLYRNPFVLEVEWYVLLMLTVLEASRKLVGVLTYSSVRQFCTQAENLVEWCVIVSVFATSFVFTGRTYAPWQSHVGAFAVLCGWSNLMLMIGQLPMFGAYVAMFTSVQAQVFKLLLAYACLLVGFTASFCVIFPRSKSFSSPHTGLIKVLVMMTGELDFEELFFPGGEEGGRPVDVGGTSWILLQVSAQLSFVLFLLFVTIVLMNLLVGIAVHDIKGLQKTAGLAKLVRQTKLICDLEAALFLGLLPQCLMRVLRWTALVLPSPLKAVLTVRPLNPREKRLPRDVLACAYKVARERKSIVGGGSSFLYSTVSSKRSGNSVYGYSRFDGNSSIRRKATVDEIAALDEAAKLRDEVAELRRICENNNQLVAELVDTLAVDKRVGRDLKKDA
ncbi:transient receptor potential channel pyrexia-like, partial [Copidosoma floridanum]|uniref:transient receptor potential channel pyrexia-like n=1 Tax=Copidosoma floridanum TaxID=29053 RepID=UPI0006C97E59